MLLISCVVCLFSARYDAGKYFEKSYIKHNHLYVRMCGYELYKYYH